MAHLVGGTLLIPGSAWSPEQDESTVAKVVHYSRPTRFYPEGRVRVLCDDGTDVWWDVAKLPDSWITELPPNSPTAAFAATPSRPSRRSAAITPTITGRTRASSRSRRSSHVGDGYDSSAAAGALSDGDGTALPGTSTRVTRSRSAAKALSPAGPVVALGNASSSAAAPAGPDPLELGAMSGDEPPTTGTRQRGRPRKSLRFAPGTYSPRGAAAAVSAAGTGAGGSSPAAAVDGAAPTSPMTSPQAAGLYADGDVDGLQAYEVAAAAAAGFSSVPPELPWTRRVRNTALIFLVMLPALYFHRLLQSGCSAAQKAAPLASVWKAEGCGLCALGSSDMWCALGHQEPLLAVNLVFFLNIDVLFWVIGLLQGSTWLIDPFWQIAPVLIGLFYQFHPAAVTQPLRSRLVMGLLWLWAVRMTHSYFRREEWQVGAREDWRYARMSRRYGRLKWAAVSFFAVGIVQHLMLVGITLPLLAVHTSAAPWSPLWDTAVFMCAAAGIMTSLTADNQLRVFMLENQKRVRDGREPLLLLDTGLWRYSRHPNFFGEQLWWWSLAAWAVLCGQPWMVVGAAFNSLCFIPITRMTEERMMERAERRPFYQHYQETTSVWVPWPPKH